MKCPSCGRGCIISPERMFWECLWCEFSVLVKGSGHHPTADDIEEQIRRKDELVKIAGPIPTPEDGLAILQQMSVIEYLLSLNGEK